MGRQTVGRLFKRNGVYWLDYAHKGERHRVTLGTQNKSEAEEKRAVILRPFSAGTDFNRRREAYTAMKTAEEIAEEAKRDATGRLTLADAWDAFMDTKPDAGPHTLSDYKGHMERLTTWLAAEYPKFVLLEDITPEVAKKHMAYLDGLGIGPNRYNKAVCALRLVFRKLAPDCNDMADPFRNISRRKLRPVRHGALKKDEVKRILQSATGELRRVLYLGAYTGMRIADCCMLNWQEVELYGTVPRIVRAMSKTLSQNKEPVKIPLHPRLRAVLEEVPEINRVDQVNPEFALLYGGDEEQGKKANRVAVSKRIRDHFAACKIKGVNTRAALKARKESGIASNRLRAPALSSFHSFRHYFVTVLHDNHVPIETAMELVGHNSKVVHQVYMHTDEDKAQKAITTLPGFGALPPAGGDDIEKLREKVFAKAKTANAESLRRMFSA